MFDVQILRDRLDIVSRAQLTDDWRWHLGASEVSEECDRKTWAKFRWLKKEDFEGRMLRLFKRGHDEELKLTHWLEAIGVSVVRIDPATGKQYKFSAIHGHYGGSWDGIGTIAEFPERFIVEYKTHNDKSFKHVKKYGVKKSKPRHFAQMGNYGRANDVRYALYVYVNKNDDDIDFEFVELNYELADALTRKAGDIITSPHPLPKIAASQTHHICQMCFMRDVCFNGEQPAKNCRSCISAEPHEGGEWFCKAWNNVIPRDFVPHGCDNWRPVV